MHPGRFYKYQPITEQTLANLATHSLWFSPPAAFNDPFDCALQIVSPTLTDSETSDAARFAQSRVPAEYQEELARFTETAEFRTLVASSIRDVVEKERTEALQNCGLCCLSTISDSLLMWSHYADGHQGMCLEFDAATYPFLHAKPVVYSSTVPSFSAIEVIRGAVDPLVEALVLTKGTCWEYENEWRIPFPIGRTTVAYPPAALTAVLLGARTSPEHQALVARVTAANPTPLFRMAIRPDDFGLVASQWEGPTAEPPPNDR